MIGEEVYCASCGKRITPAEPDVMLEDPDGDVRLYFHRRCAWAAVCIAAADPGHYELVYRQIYAVLN